MATDVKKTKEFILLACPNSLGVSRPIDVSDTPAVQSPLLMIFTTSHDLRNANEISMVG